jgi:hypothetical protein
MKKLTAKWKLFLLVNYLLLIVTGVFILFEIGLILFTSNTTAAKKPGAMIYALVFFLLICLICLLNIIIVHRFFPKKPLSGKPKQLFIISRIILAVLAVFLFLSTVASLFMLISKPDPAGYLVTIFSVLLFGCSTIVVILQFQIPQYLNKNNTENIDLLIESIGK